MEARVELSTLIVSVIAVVVIEAAAKLIIASWVAPTLLVVIIARALQIGLIAQVISKSDSGGQGVCLSRHEIWPGVRHGLIWSACFALISGGGLAVLLIAGFDLRGLLGVRLPYGAANMVLFYLVGGLLSPVAEELFFRGVIYGYFRKWGAVVAFIVSTLVFVLAHRPGTVLPVPQIVGGMAFAVSYELSRNLLAPLTIHILGNLAMFTVTFIYSTYVM